MTDIKLPPMPEGYGYDEEDIEDYAREAVRLNAQAVPDEPDWRHPKIQGLIGSEARLRITIELIWQILEDPNQEFTASDMEYWDAIHDKLKEALSTEPAQKPLTDEQRRFLLFLEGAADWDGVWFGARHPSKEGAFWWRRDMRQVFYGIGVKT